MVSSWAMDRWAAAKTFSEKVFTQMKQNLQSILFVCSQFWRPFSCTKTFTILWMYAMSAWFR